MPSLIWLALDASSHISSWLTLVTVIALIATTTCVVLLRERARRHTYIAVLGAVQPGTTMRKNGFVISRSAGRGRVSEASPPPEARS